MFDAQPLTGKRVLLPLPAQGHDAATVAVPWMKLRMAGAQVVFATPDGNPGRVDTVELPGVLKGLARSAEATAIHEVLVQAPEFCRPLCWEAIDPIMFDGVVLPGGHGPGMKTFLESVRLQQKVAAFFGTGRPLGAICRGPVLLARATDPRTGRCALNGRTTSGLPRAIERSAWALSAWRTKRHFRTYSVYAEDEITEAVGSAGAFVRGPLRTPFVVEDGNYVSARWAQDAWAFADTYVQRLARSTATRAGKVLRLPMRAA